MNQSCFIDPEDVLRIDLESVGHWIEIKRELSFAEEQALAGAMMGDFKTSGAKPKPGQKAEVFDASVGFDMRKFQIERFAIWIVDWSLVNKKGAVVPVTKDAIANLRPVIAEAIDAALDAHVDQLEQEKKAMTAGRPVAGSSA